MLKWIIFFAVLILLFLVDVFFIRKNSDQTSKKFLYLSIFYVLVGMVFSFYVSYIKGPDSGREYLTGFILEKTLSIDNLFLMIGILDFLQVPQKFRHRVILYGIIGVIVLRGIAIFVGGAVLHYFEWALYLMGVVIIFTGLKTILLYIKKKEPEKKIENMYLYKFLNRHFNIYPKIEGDNFFIKIDGKYYITKLFVALILIEFVDLVFAIDSIPTIFGITQDLYIVYSSNIFAIMGLRSLFFVLEGVLLKFKHVKLLLAMLLILIGCKILISFFIKIPAYVSLISIFVICGAFFLFSYFSFLLQKRR